MGAHRGITIVGFANLRDQALGAHAVRPDKFGGVRIAAQRSRKGSSAVDGQHMQQGLWEEAAQEGALPDGRARACWDSTLEVLRQMRHL